MENIRLEDIWKRRLKASGWSDRASVQLRASWAKSTLGQYNRHVRSFANFCDSNGYVFPPDRGNTAVFADFFCKVADQSDRPESILKMYSAAISCLYEGLKLDNPMCDLDLKRLITALIKSGTKRPAKRTEVMPVTPFVTYFKSQPVNAELSTKQLRLKAITLLALTYMARPSDLAPRGERYDPEDNVFIPHSLARNNIVFHEDGSLSVTFFGIKNDTSRSGFEVRVPRAQDHIVDPVVTIKDYIDRTAHLTSTTGPLFLSLNKPHTAITAESISRILAEVIDLVGLGDRGFNAKCFRPTAANAAVKAGCDPETAMYIGRWKTKEVFFNHYVFPLAPAKYTGSILQYSGLHY